MRTKLSILPRRRSSLARDIRGSTATVFALSTLAIVLCVGGATDFARVYARRAELQTAADGAALTAARIAKEKRAEGVANWKALGRRAGESQFTTLVAAIGDASVGAPVIAVDGNSNVDSDDRQITATLEFRAAVATAFLQLARIPNVTLSGTAKASVESDRYIDVHFLVDVTGSMGIGATPADQQTMYDRIGCALACHVNMAGYPDNYAAARASGARLRIDVVRDAIRQFIADARRRVGTADMMRISIDLFGSQIIPLLGPTTDLAAADAAAARIELMTPPDNLGTNITYSLAQLNRQYPASGDGVTPAARKSYVVVMSDGVENSRYGLQQGAPGTVTSETLDPNFTYTNPSLYAGGYETVQAIGPLACEDAKRAGHIILTGLIDYLIPAASAGYAAGANRFAFISLTKPVIEERMRLCASDNTLAFNAHTSDELMEMLGNISNAIFGPKRLRLTQ